MKDGFAYLPLVASRMVWGLVVTSTGFVRTPPGSIYPSKSLSHPADHLFTWARGRTLDCFQLLTIQRGGGWFESAPSGRIRIEEGAAFVLYPGVWHRYAPDEQTGWDESWIELEGPVLDRLRDVGELDERRPVFLGALSADVAGLMRECHDLADVQPPGYGGQLSAAALRVVSLVVASRAMEERPPSQAQEVVRRAKIRLLEGFDEPLRIRDVARELGIAESHFRRIFKASTGLSPKEYLIDLRLRQVRILLRGSPLTLGEIAARTGYDSAYHLSAEFKKRVGIAPSQWRAARRVRSDESG